MRRKRADGNQDDILDALKKAGYGVLNLSQLGGGAPDALVCRGSFCCLLEIKCPGGKVRPGQAQFHATWPGHIAVVRSVDEALAVMAEPGPYRKLSAPSFA